MCEKESGVWYLHKIINNNNKMVCGIPINNLNDRENNLQPQHKLLVLLWLTLFIFHDGKVYEAPKTVKK